MCLLCLCLYVVFFINVCNHLCSACGTLVSYVCVCCVSMTSLLTPYYYCGAMQYKSSSWCLFVPSCGYNNLIQYTYTCKSINFIVIVVMNVFVCRCYCVFYVQGLYLQAAIFAPYTLLSWRPVKQWFGTFLNIIQAKDSRLTSIFLLFCKRFEVTFRPWKQITGEQLLLASILFYYFPRAAP